MTDSPGEMVQYVLEFTLLTGELYTNVEPAVLTMVTAMSSM